MPNRFSPSQGVLGLPLPSILRKPIYIRQVKSGVASGAVTVTLDAAPARGNVLLVFGARSGGAGASPFTVSGGGVTTFTKRGQSSTSSSPTAAFYDGAVDAAASANVSVSPSFGSGNTNVVVVELGQIAGALPTYENNNATSTSYGMAWVGYTQRSFLFDWIINGIAGGSGTTAGIQGWQTGLSNTLGCFIYKLQDPIHMVSGFNSGGAGGTPRRIFGTCY